MVRDIIIIDKNVLIIVMLVYTL